MNKNEIIAKLAELNTNLSAATTAADKKTIQADIDKLEVELSMIEEQENAQASPQAASPQTDTDKTIIRVMKARTAGKGVIINNKYMIPLRIVLEEFFMLNPANLEGKSISAEIGSAVPPRDGFEPLHFLNNPVLTGQDKLIEKQQELIMEGVIARRLAALDN